MLRVPNLIPSISCAMSFARKLSTEAVQPLNKNLTKIVATIGPVSEQLPMLSKVTDAGLNIMRINFSHATFEEANLRATNIKLCPGPDKSTASASLDTNLRGVMLDTQGPEIRTGMFGDGLKELELIAGEIVVLSTDDALRTRQTAGKIWISYKKLYDTVVPGTRILLDDGAIELVVERKASVVGEIVCIVQNSGILGNKKGVNIPNLSVDLPAMCEKDEIDIKWGVENDVDYIAASFVRKASDVKAIREYAAELLSEKKTRNTSASVSVDDPKRDFVYALPLIISKIESTEALANFDSILDESDAIMVARGDLGVEIPMEFLASYQKEIVSKCNLAGKPVIVATQMLESMQKNPRPTRAECTDVYNAVFDGADCVMLSGESAKGKYPVQAVSMMQKIVKQAENWVGKNHDDPSVVRVFPPLPIYAGSLGHAYGRDLSASAAEVFDTSQGIVYGITEASRSLHTSCIINIAKSGRSAIAIAKYRPNVPIVCYVRSAKLGRFLQLYRGIHPVLVPDSFPDVTSDTSIDSVDRFDLLVSHAKSLGYCMSGDNVIIAAADPKGAVTSSAVTMRVCTVL